MAATIDHSKVNERHAVLAPPDLVKGFSKTNEAKECFVNQQFCSRIQHYMVNYAFTVRSVVPIPMSSEE